MISGVWRKKEKEIDRFRNNQRPVLEKPTSVIQPHKIDKSIQDDIDNMVEDPMDLIILKGSSFMQLSDLTADINKFMSGLFKDFLGAHIYPPNTTSTNNLMVEFKFGPIDENQKSKDSDAVYAIESIKNAIPTGNSGEAYVTVANNGDVCSSISHKLTEYAEVFFTKFIINESRKEGITENFYFRTEGQSVEDGKLKIGSGYYYEYSSNGDFGRRDIESVVNSINLNLFLKFMYNKGNKYRSKTENYVYDAHFMNRIDCVTGDQLIEILKADPIAIAHFERSLPQNRANDRFSQYQYNKR
jgi:hypothetical protein